MDPFPLITFLLETVTPVIKQEATLILEAGDNVQSLHAKLQFIDKHLKKCYDRFMEDTMVKEWLTQIQDLAHEAKDIIETFQTKNGIHKRRSIADKLFHGVPHVTMLSKVSKKVNRIKEKIQEIDDYKKKYCIDRQASFRDLNRSNSLEKHRREVEEENVVGFDDAMKQVTEMLLNKKRPSRDVISIVGMTGAGKTTLAKMIYGTSGKQFEYRAWVFVASKYRMRNVLLGILEKLMSIGEDITKLDDKKLGEKLRRFLQGKRYLIVMDGVEETQLWQALEKDKIFPYEKHGSRVLLTTCSKNVASLASLSSDRIHNMQPLDDEARWELLEKSVFKDERCPHQLVRIGKQIAAKCAGLPLAIVSLASLLARDVTYRTWLDILSNTSWYLNREDSPPCLKILALNYNTITDHLKLCLLYLGAFPSGCEIHARQVINLWIAEGLIKEKDGASTDEKIAERYLKELINLSLIEVVRKRSDGGVKTFQIHEFWRNFCISESERIRFLDVQMQARSHPPRSHRQRRLSIHHDLRYILSNPHSLSHLHSLLCFHNKGSVDSNDFTFEFRHLPSIRVLDLGSTDVTMLDGSIKSSPLLKYLRINHPSLNRLPSSFSLPYLQTLDMKNTRVTCLPIGIWGMEYLRHLLLPRQTTLPKCPDDPKKRWLYLQTISAITPDRKTAQLIKVSKFPSLVKLTLNSQDIGKTKTCLEWLYKLTCLQQLKIINPASFPISGTFPATLVKVTLVKTDLVSDDAMRMLENLDHLQVLKLLTKSIRGPELEMRPKSFPQLRFLFMEEIFIRNWSMGDKAMGSLEELTITRCHDLESLPKQLGQLHSIRLVKVNSPSHRLKRELQQSNMKWCDVQIRF